MRSSCRRSRACCVVALFVLASHATANGLRRFEWQVPATPKSADPPATTPRFTIDIPLAGSRGGETWGTCSVPVRVLHAWHGEARDFLGRCLLGLGDVTGDGVPDVAIGAVCDDAFDSGALAAYSGASGERLWCVKGDRTPPGDFGPMLGRAMCLLDDLDGDGARDLAVPVWMPRCRVQFRSGRTGAVLGVYEVREPKTVLAGEDPHLDDIVFAGPDADRDGAKDVLVYVEGNRQDEWTEMVSSRKRARLFAAPGRPLGVIGDRDGDGVEDFLVGTEPFFRAHVEARSGRTGELLADLTPPNGDRSEHLELGPDVDRDGLKDWMSVVAATDERVDGLPIACRLVVRSSRDGHMLLEVPIDGAFDGRTCGDCNAGDVDADGTGDFWLRCIFGNEPKGTRVLVLSGVDGHEIARIDSKGAIAKRASPIGDVDGDGRGDVLVGDDWSSIAGARWSGAAYVLSFPKN